VPEKWKLGDASSFAIDAQDNVWLLHRPRTLKPEDAGKAAPAIARVRPGAYVEVKRTWKTGDALAINLPKALHLEPLPDNPRRVAILWGPLVLAGDLGPESPSRGRNRNPPPVPVLVAQDTVLAEDASQLGRFEFQPLPAVVDVRRRRSQSTCRTWPPLASRSAAMIFAARSEPSAIVFT